MVSLVTKQALSRAVEDYYNLLKITVTYIARMLLHGRVTSGLWVVAALRWQGPGSQAGWPGLSSPCLASCSLLRTVTAGQGLLQHSAVLTLKSRGNAAGLGHTLWLVAGARSLCLISFFPQKWPLFFKNKSLVSG